MSLKTPRGGGGIAANVDQADRAKKAYDDFIKEGKEVHQDKGKRMVDAAAAFFKADSAVKKCEERRARHVAESQERHANAVLRFHLLSEEIEGLVAIRRRQEGKRMRHTVTSRMTMMKMKRGARCLRTLRRAASSHQRAN